MKKFVFLLVLLMLGTFATTGCKKAEKTAEEARETGIDKRVEEKVKAEKFLLTEQEVQSFIKAYPVFVEICKRHEKEVSDDVSVLNDARMLQEYGEYKEEFDGALKKYGHTLESFAATFVKVMGTLAFGATTEAMGGGAEGMKQMLDNPNLPQESREEIEKSLAKIEEFKKSEEGKACEENWPIVKKYEGELKALFEEEEEE